MARREPEHARNFLNYADVVSRAADYCHHLAENWKQTSRKTAEYDFIDLVALVRSVKEVIFFNNNAIVLSGVSQAKIHGSHFELTRVLQNLLKNGLEAGSTRVSVTFGLTAEHVTLLIADNGDGMDEETARKAMKGGFTTKANGTGLGLGICRHLLAAHGATMKLESAKAKGTKILIAFPVSGK
jgi:signal transduction histidine kinase